MSVSFFSPKSQGDFPRGETSEEEGNDRQFRRECQVPDLGCEFCILFSAGCPSRTLGCPGRGEAGPPHGHVMKKLIELGEVLEKSQGQDRH